MFSAVETIVKQTELLTLAEQWELLTHLMQQLRRPMLPPATRKRPPHFRNCCETPRVFGTLGMD